MRNLIGSNPASDSDDDDDDDDDDDAPPSSDRRMAARTADAAPPAPGYDDALEIKSRFAVRALSSRADGEDADMDLLGNDDDDDDDDDDFSPPSSPVPRDGADAEEEESSPSAAAREETDDGCCCWGRARTVSIKERSSGVRTMPRSFPMMARRFQFLILPVFLSVVFVT
jgi:hypothetical protein